MGYWMHVYSRCDEVMEVEEIRAHFEIEGQPVVVASDPPNRGPAWKSLVLTHPDQCPITQITLRTGRSLAGYLKEEIESVRSALPSCNAEWLERFLREVKAVYAFQILRGTDVGDGWRFVHGLMDELIMSYDSILHAELEGYSHGGLQLTDEYTSSASGERWVGLHDARTDDFRQFPIELSDPAHREAFRAGRVPDGVKAR
jgi:hypothetical protein